MHTHQRYGNVSPPRFRITHGSTDVMLLIENDDDRSAALKVFDIIVGRYLAKAEDWGRIVYGNFC